MSFSRKLAILFLLFLLDSLFVLGDDFFRIKDRITDESLFRLGLFYVTPRLTLDNLGYITNIYQYNSDPEPDFTADIGVDVRLSAIVGHRLILVLNDHPYYTYYAENKQDEAWNNRFRFSVYSYLGSFDINFSLNRDNLRQRPSSEFGVRLRYITESEKISIDYGNHSRFYINVYAEQNRMLYDENNYLEEYNLEQYMDRNQYKLGINLNKIIFSRTVLFISLEYYQYRFQNHTDRDGDAESVSVGMQFPIIGSVTGSFQLGYQWSQPNNPMYMAYSSLSGSGEIKLVLLKRFRLSLEYSLDNYFSFYDPDAYYYQQSISGGIEFYLNRNLKLGYKHLFGLNSYKNIADSSVIRKDKLQQFRFFVGIKIFKKMGIGLEYSEFEVNSDIENYSRSYKFFGGYITYDF